MASVVFAMEWVPSYRVPFYEGLRKRLASEGIDIRLVHGDPPASRRRRRDDESLPWAEVVPNRFWPVAGLELTYQPVMKRLAGADLIIVQQETGLLLNYPLLVKARLGGTPIALWGHGHNSNPAQASAPAEWVKVRVTRFADWVFAYTERSAEVFRSIGVPANRITVVQNAVDAGALTDPQGTPSTEVAELVAGLRQRGARVGWITSALDRWKRVDVLIDTLDATRGRLDTFEFVAVGAGDELLSMERAAEDRPWLHVLGSRFGADRALVGEVAEVTIHPGLIGLHVLDSFVTASPMVTADIEYHSHEIDYLDPGRNSLVLPAEATADELADAVVTLLTDASMLAELQHNCLAAARVYTIDAMIDRFAGGIRSALAAAA